MGGVYFQVQEVWIDAKEPGYPVISKKQHHLVQLEDIPSLQQVILASSNLRGFCHNPAVRQSPSCVPKVTHHVAPLQLQHNTTGKVLSPGDKDSGDVSMSPVMSHSSSEGKEWRFRDEVPEKETVSCINWKCLCSSGKSDNKHKQGKTAGAMHDSSPQQPVEIIEKQPNGILKGHTDSVQYSGGIHVVPANCVPVLPPHYNGREHYTGSKLQPPAIAYHCRDRLTGEQGCAMLTSSHHQNYLQFEYAYPDFSSTVADDGPLSSVFGSNATSVQGHSKGSALGKCILKFGKKAPASVRDPGSFSNPSCIDVFPNGDLAILDNENYTLQLFTQKGHCKKVYQFQREITDLVVLDHSSVALLRDRDLGIFNLQEHAVRDVNLPDCNNPVAIAKIQHSRYHVNYVVAMATYVITYKGNGEIIKKIQNYSMKKNSKTEIKYHLTRITGITVHKRTKDIYVLDCGSRAINVFSSKGGFKYGIDTTQFSVGAMSGLGKLCVDSIGNIVIADSRNHRLLQHSRGGAVTCLLDYSRDYVPTAVLVTDDGRLVAAINSEGRSFAGVRVYNYRHH